MAENEQGFNPKRYQVIPRTLIFLFDGDNVLLLKGRPDKKIWAGLYNGLGGHVEEGEDALAAARRELHEESGIAHSQLDLCGIVTINLKDRKGIMLFVFRGESHGQELIDSEEGALEWVEMSRLDAVPVVEDLRTILPLVGKWRRGDQPFFARYFYDDAGRLQIEINRDSSLLK